MIVGEKHGLCLLKTTQHLLTGSFFAYSVRCGYSLSIFVCLLCRTSALNLILSDRNCTLWWIHTTQTWLIRAFAFFSYRVLWLFYDFFNGKAVRPNCADKRLCLKRYIVRPHNTGLKISLDGSNLHALLLNYVILILLYFFLRCECTR